MPETDPRMTVWNQAQTYARKLHEALEELDDLGGAGGLMINWTPQARARAVQTLAAVHAAVGAHLARLKGGAKPVKPPRPDGPPLRGRIRN